MIQEEIDFPEEKYCKDCGCTLNEENKKSDRWYMCKKCDNASYAIRQESYRKANTDPDKVWDPNYNKVCPLCKEEKNAEQYFRRNISKKDGYNALCKPCHQSPGQKFNSMKRDAKRRGYDWTLEQHDTSSLFLSDCYYCGKPSQEGVKIHGLDRVENDRGYHLDNVVPCCYNCNIAKAGQTQEDFIDMCKRVADKHYKTYTKDASEWIKVYVENMQVGEIKEENFIDPIW